MKNQYLIPLKKAFLENVNSLNAPKMEAYMKNHFKFYGIKSPELKLISSTFYKQNGVPKIENLEKIVKECWQQDKREWQYFAVNLCIKVKKLCLKEHIKLFKYITINKSWWDTVDMIASNLVSNYFLKYPNNKNQYLELFNNSENMWLNRVAILHQLKYRTEVDEFWLKKCCLKHSESNEFFHKKAIGWALREYSKYNKEWVSNFVSSHKFSNLTVKESLKYITK